MYFICKYLINIFYYKKCCFIIIKFINIIKKLLKYLTQIILFN